MGGAAVKEGNAIVLLIFPEFVVNFSNDGRFMPDVRRIFTTRHRAGFLYLESGA